MSGLCLGNQCMWITTTRLLMLTLSKLQVKKEWLENIVCVHPRNLAWNPKMKVWKTRFLFKWVIFRFHVSFPGWNGCLSNPYSKLLWRILMILMIYVMHCPVWSESNLQLEWPLGPYRVWFQSCCIFMMYFHLRNWRRFRFSGRSPRTFVPAKTLTYTPQVQHVTWKYLLSKRKLLFQSAIFQVP